jgi:heme a synthase
LVAAAKLFLTVWGLIEIYLCTMINQPAKNFFTLHRVVSTWLLIGVLWIIVQIFIGGVTRLTGSGLSITKWEIVTGTLPPMSQQAWESEFALYRETPQYLKINKGMDLDKFKFIYFWEYFHRLWARMLGFVFLIPLCYFLYRKWIPSWLLKRFGVTFLLGVLVASMGWIMVASGLIHRPWVNAYKLTLHLSFALVLLSHLWWTFLLSRGIQPLTSQTPKAIRSSRWLLGFVCFQIVLGGIMSGMKAGLFYPTWPDMQGSYLPSVLLDGSAWNYNNFVAYDSHPFMSALIQVLHRNTAYFISLLVVLYLFRHKAAGSTLLKSVHWALGGLLVLQIGLGIFTLIGCKGEIPVVLGVSHQLVGVLLLLCCILLVFVRTRTNNFSVSIGQR